MLSVGVSVRSVPDGKSCVISTMHHFVAAHSLTRTHYTPHLDESPMKIRYKAVYHQISIIMCLSAAHGCLIFCNTGKDSLPLSCLIKIYKY